MSARRFTYTALPARVVFGPGRQQDVDAELGRLGISNAIVLTTAGRADMGAHFARMIGARAGGVFAGALMHTPVATTEAAMETVRRVDADGILAIGGGSAIGLGKAIAYRTDLPQVAVPTTYAGSEMTPFLGETEKGQKTTLRSPRVLPETVIYDPELTTSLPATVSGPSGMNAIAHAVDALYAEGANPITTMMAEEAMRALGAALPRIAINGDDMEARADALYGAWLAGACLGSLDMALHHKICHTLGGSFNLPHADVHAVMLPYTAAYNRAAAPAAMARVGTALKAEDGPIALYELLHRVGRVTSLADLGLAEPALDKAAALAVENPYRNPRPVTEPAVRDMLQAAYEGRSP
ncbi:MAG: maleylacetate reductase [Alphaproteobacteria bacterium]